MADVFRDEIVKVMELNALAYIPEEPEIVDSLASGSFVLFDDDIVNGWEDHSWDGDYSYVVDDGSGKLLLNQGERLHSRLV